MLTKWVSFYCVRMILKIIIKKAKLPRLGVSNSEEVMLE